MLNGLGNLAVCEVMVDSQLKNLRRLELLNKFGHFNPKWLLFILGNLEQCLLA